MQVEVKWVLRRIFFFCFVQLGVIRSLRSIQGRQWCKEGVSNFFSLVLFYYFFGLQIILRIDENYVFYISKNVYIYKCVYVILGVLQIFLLFFIIFKLRVFVLEFQGRYIICVNFLVKGKELMGSIDKIFICSLFGFFRIQGFCLIFVEYLFCVKFGVVKFNKKGYRRESYIM